MVVSAQVTFVDLSAFSELEGFLYGGPLATTWFVGTVQKSNWFSLVPTTLRDTSTPNFGLKTSSSINRTADYALYCWFRVQIPQIMLNPDPTIYDNATVRWTKKLGHNLFNDVTLTHNELVAQEFNSYWLDMNYMFHIPEGKRVGYNSMIGNVAANYNPVLKGVALGTGSYISVPLPFWFSRDTGRALPVAALPFNQTNINYEWRQLSELVVVYPGVAGGGGSRIATVSDVVVYGQPTVTPTFINPQTYCMYAMVHNDERAKMAQAPRDILMHQLQTVQVIPFSNVSSGAVQSFDIRLSNSIVALYFAAENTSIFNAPTASGMERSNYTTEIEYSGDDPLDRVQLLYENNVRLDYGSDVFAYILPYHHCDQMPDETGYHIWSYALNTNDLNPCGSTNYTKLANVTIQYTPSASAQNAANTITPVRSDGTPLQWVSSTGALIPLPQTYQHILIARNHNIGRVANGSFGFPTL